MTRLVNVNELGHALVIAETGQEVSFGDEVDVEDPALAEGLIASGLWARPTTKAAKAAAKEGK